MLDRFKEKAKSATANTLRRMANMLNEQKQASLIYDNRAKVKRWIKLYEGKNIHGALERGGYIAPSIVSKIANKVTIEMESEILYPESAPIISEGYSNLIERSKFIIEQLLVQGAGVMRPIYYLNDKLGDRIEVEYIPASKVIPIDFDEQDRLVKADLLCVFTENGKTYTHVESHDYNRHYQVHKIENKLFEGDILNFNTGHQISLASSRKTSNLEREVIFDDCPFPMFVYLKTPFGNDVDMNSPLGVSIFSKIEGLIEDYKKAYGNYMKEIIGTGLMINAPVNVVEGMLENEPYDSPLRDILYPVPVIQSDRVADLAKAGIVGVFSPEIREDPLNKALENILRKIEFATGLARGTFSDVGQVDKTAEEIRASKQETYSTVVDIQKAYEKALREIAKIMTFLAVYNGELNVSIEDLEISFYFDDSIIANKDKDINVMMAMVEKGMIAKEEMVAEFFKCSIDEARIKMPKEAVVNQEDFEN